MAEILTAVFAGLLIGLSMSLIILPFNKEKELKKVRLQANLQLYHEVLLRRHDRTYKYSPTVRDIINTVHINLLLEGEKTSSSVSNI